MDFEVVILDLGELPKFSVIKGSCIVSTHEARIDPVSFDNFQKDSFFVPLKGIKIHSSDSNNFDSVAAVWQSIFNEASRMKSMLEGTEKVIIVFRTLPHIICSPTDADKSCAEAAYGIVAIGKSIIMSYA